MTGKQVAVKSDVKVTASTSTSVANATGIWTAGKPTFSEYDKLKLADKKVIYQVKCTFTFTGNDNTSGTPIPPVNSDITLTAKTTKLQKSISQVLVDGDSFNDTYDNKVEITASQKLLCTSE